MGHHRPLRAPVLLLTYQKGMGFVFYLLDAVYILARSFVASRVSGTQMLIWKCTDPVFCRQDDNAIEFLFLRVVFQQETLWQLKQQSDPIRRMRRAGN